MKFSDPKGLFLIKLNHINLPVADVAASRDFFARYFGMKTTTELGRGAVALMRDECDMVLMLGQFDKSAEIHQRTDFHVGFHLPTREEVDNVHALMTSDGHDVGLSRSWKGLYGSYLQAPGGFTTEFGFLEGTGAD